MLFIFKSSPPPFALFGVLMFEFLLCLIQNKGFRKRFPRRKQNGNSCSASCTWKWTSLTSCMTFVWTCYKVGGSAFQKKLRLVWFTLSLLRNHKSRTEGSSPPLWQVCALACWIHPTKAAVWAVSSGTLDSSNKGCCLSSFVAMVVTLFPTKRGLFLLNYEIIIPVSPGTYICRTD